ncbi:MAG: hypothetical protein AAF603_03200 [Pseudomonadota bacterium]
MRYSISILTLFVLSVTSPAMAAHSWTSAIKIDTLQVDANGDVLITLLSSHGDTECGSTGSNLKRYRLQKTNTAIYEAALSISLTGLSTGADMFFRGGGCVGSIPALGNIRISS